MTAQLMSTLRAPWGRARIPPARHPYRGWPPAARVCRPSRSLETVSFQRKCHRRAVRPDLVVSSATSAVTYLSAARQGRHPPGGRAGLGRSERLPPLIEEVPESVGPLDRGLDVDDAVGGMGV